MNSIASEVVGVRHHPVDLRVEPALVGRDRMTVAFRIILALPHLLLVGMPIAAGLSWSWTAEEGTSYGLGNGGALGAVAGLIAVIAWFAILFSGAYPQGLRSLVEYYLRWRVRAVAYTALLRDEYPPFGEGQYPVELDLPLPPQQRDKLTVAFRIVLAIPHLIAVWALGVAWCLTTIIAWFSILFTGNYPETLYKFAVGVFRWGTRVEAYLLLLHDEYPPFTLD